MGGLRLAALLVLASCMHLARAASTTQLTSCVDFGYKISEKSPIVCEANDFGLKESSATVEALDISPCVNGLRTTRLKFTTFPNANIRYDVGIWISQVAGQSPQNRVPGTTCSATKIGDKDSDHDGCLDVDVAKGESYVYTTEPLTIPCAGGTTGICVSYDNNGKLDCNVNDAASQPNNKFANQTAPGTPAKCECELVDIIEPPPELTIEKTMFSKCVPAAKVIGVRIDVTNSGGLATNLIIKDILPKSPEQPSTLTYVSGSAVANKPGVTCTGINSNSAVKCTLASLPASSPTLTIRFDMEGTIMNDVYENTANVEADDVYAISDTATYDLTVECTTSGTDDPHFVGAHGVKYDFNGSPDDSYCLVTDPNIHINMLVNGYYGGDHANTLENAHHAKDPKVLAAMREGDAHAELYSWMRELIIFWRVGGRKHTLRLAARGGRETERGVGFMKSIELDGRALSRLSNGGSFEDAESLVSMSLAYETSPQWDGTGNYDVDFYSLRIGDLLAAEIRVRTAHPMFWIASDAETHLNLKITMAKLTKNVHGVLGQTYRDDRVERTAYFEKINEETHQNIKADKPSGKGFLDGEMSDYKTSDIYSTNCAFNRFTEPSKQSASRRLLSSSAR